jgi:hypothetical protein
MNIKKTFKSGSQERSIIKPIFEVYESGRYLSIIPDTDELASVSTRTGNGRTIDNFSDPNKWALNNKIEANGNITESKIIIDRNTGRIVYSLNWNANTLYVEGEGICEKIDISRRKF